MLKHFNIVVLFLVTLFILLYFDQTTEIHWSAYAILLIIFSAIEFYGAAYIRSGFHLKAFCKKESDEKIVALTFDDGPSENTLKILNVLKTENVKATFFCIGKSIKGNEAILKQTFEAGHTIGNHSYSHGHLFDLKNADAMESDLLQAAGEIKNITGRSPLYFRPPYGVTTPAMARVIKKLKYEVIGWNIRSLDTKHKDPQVVLQRIKKRLVPGSVVLLHDTMPGTEIVVKELLIYLKEQNYKIVALPELVQKPAYA